MSFNDAWNFALALLLAGALAVVGSFAFLTDHDRRAVSSRTVRVAGVGAAGCWNWSVNLLLWLWVLASWKRVTRNLGLAYADRHATIKYRTYHGDGKLTEREHPKITYPHRLVRPDAYGVVLTVWTRAGIGRAEFEKVAEHLANTWRCRRVQVSQRKPGRITVRALRRDPLAARLSLSVPQVTAEERGTTDAVEHIRPAA